MVVRSSCVAAVAAPSPPSLPRCPACGGRETPPTALLTKGKYRLHRCAGCRTEFYVEVQRADELAPVKEYWEPSKFEIYADDAVRLAFERRYTRLLDVARREVGSIESLLDVGCGIGGFVAFAQSQGLRAVGSDVSPEAVAHARGQGLDVHLADDLDRFVPDGSLDALTMWDVVEHLVEPVSVLEQVVRKVRPGGSLLFETPDGAFPIRKALLGLNKASAGRVDLTGPMYYWQHKAYFTEAGLRALLDRVGVDVVWLERATSVREKMDRQFDVNAKKGSWKGAVLHRTWPVLETTFRTLGRGNKLLVVARRR